MARKRKRRSRRTKLNAAGRRHVENRSIVASAALLERVGEARRARDRRKRREAAVFALLAKPADKRVRRLRRRVSVVLGNPSPGGRKAGRAVVLEGKRKARVPATIYSRSVVIHLKRGELRKAVKCAKGLRARLRLKNFFWGASGGKKADLDRACEHVRRR